MSEEKQRGDEKGRKEEQWEEREEIRNRNPKTEANPNQKAEKEANDNINAHVSTRAAGAVLRAEWAFGLMGCSFLGSFPSSAFFDWLRRARFHRLIL